MPVRDGGFEFSVLETGRAKQVGDPTTPGLSVDAHGVFIVITLTIRNVGNAPLTFIDRDQTLIDDRGEPHAVSNAADIYGNRGIRSTTIGPGKRSMIVRTSSASPRPSPGPMARTSNGLSSRLR